MRMVTLLKNKCSTINVFFKEDFRHLSVYFNVHLYFSWGPGISLHKDLNFFREENLKLTEIMILNILSNKKT